MGSTGNLEAAALHDRPGFLLRRAHQLSVSIFEAQFKHLDATPAQIAALTTLHEQPLLNQSELALSIGLDKATVSVLVKALEARGLLRRQCAGAGARTVSLTLTPEGRSMVARSRQPGCEADRLLMSPLDADERERLLHLLLRLVTELEPHARAPLARAVKGARTDDGG